MAGIAMSAMEEMLARIFKQVLPDSFIQLMSQESIDRIRLRISTEWAEVKQQLDTIEANTNALVAQSGAAGYGARIFMEEGLIVDTAKEPEDALRIEAQDIHDDRGDDIGNPLPGWEQFSRPKYSNGSGSDRFNGGGSQPSSHSGRDNSTGG